MADDNGSNLDRLIGRLLARGDETQRQLMKLEDTLGRIANHHDLILARVFALEMRNAEQKGGAKMLFILSGFAATLGGIVTSFIVKMWPQY